MKPYLSIIKLRFAVQLQYRAAAAAGFFTQFFFGLVRVMVFLAFYASSTQVQPMSVEQTVTYTWLVQVTLRMIPWAEDRETINMVRSGGIAYELCRPLNLYAAWYSRLLSLKIVPAILSGLPMFVIVLLLPEPYRMGLPASPGAGLAFVVSMLGALFLGCAITNIVSISALWPVSGDGMRRLLPATVTFFSGMLIPLAFVPDWTQPVLRLLPFSGLADIPFRFYVGTLPPRQLVANLVLQLIWTVFFVLIGLWLLRAATRRVVVQGG